MTHSATEKALELIEKYEAKFLSWGLTKQELSEDELLLILSPLDDDISDLITGLLNEKLIFKVPRSHPVKYRTRMSEGVNLFAQLRQWFPNTSWESASTLVADFRFLLTPRFFPNRKFSLKEVIEKLSNVLRNDEEGKVLEAILSPAGGVERKLSEFQLDTAFELLKEPIDRNDTACIVTAGTGSGKTLAFYLPAFIKILSDAGKYTGTQILAAYPRNELLKDQLSTALQESRSVKKSDSKFKTIRLGAYFGDTPTTWQIERNKFPKSWRSTKIGKVCPFLLCPEEIDDQICKGSLTWLTEDIQENIERLVCVECGAEVTDKEIALTRNSMSKNPPDILFATTEMINRKMHDMWDMHVFGIGPYVKSPVKMFLIDEAHIYSGATGAQNAFVFRRWRNMTKSKAPVKWVGLSATLRDAELFFSNLTGVKEDFVREVAPRNEDMTQRGHEYQLLLRGDPQSQSALLSTTIQSIMLLLRLHDPIGSENSSKGIFGNKVFAFCDNLDLINRLYRQYLDAEGRDPIGKIDSRKNGSLALLRSPLHNNSEIDWRAAAIKGQEWWIVDSLRVGRVPPEIRRTSAQDTGVSSSAEVVIATASLEVGFDDPTVGGVIQHKSPRDIAQFVQRRGRAGRPQIMHPWTVVVLSDFGRDRITYQSYEQLFDPIIPPKSLPLGNRSIQKMQATFALIDWLTTKVTKRNNLRPLLSEPIRIEEDDTERTAETKKAKRKVQKEILGYLKEILEKEETRFEFLRFLSSALSLPERDIEIICWGSPRSIFLETIPTIIRRLESNWHCVKNETAVPFGDISQIDHPFPEFLPKTLFSDLCLPEIAVITPEDFRDEGNTESAFLILNELAPGKVTERYSIWTPKTLWVDPGIGGNLDISESILCDSDVIGYRKNSEGTEIEVHRPYAVAPNVTESSISTKSIGRYIWQFEGQVIGEIKSAAFSQTSKWKKIIESVDFAMQVGDSGVRILRFATEGNAEITKRVGHETSREKVSYQLCKRNEPVAIGVELEVDAFRLVFSPPNDLKEFNLENDQRRFRQLKFDKLVHELKCKLKEQDVNPFLIDLLAQLIVSSVAQESQTIPSTGSIQIDWSNDETRKNMIASFDRQHSDPNLFTDNEDTESKMRIQISEILQNETNLSIIRDEYNTLCTSPDETWIPWLRSRCTATLAAGIELAIQMLLPHFNVDSDLNIDITENADKFEIWFSESVVGGGAIVEAFHTAYEEDPRRFWTLVEAAFHPGDLEEAAINLEKILPLLQNTEIAEAAVSFRSATDEDVLPSWQTLLAEMANKGIIPSHALASSLSVRIFRDGATEETDLMIQKVFEIWKTLEKNVDIAVDLRSFCGLLLEDENFIEELSKSVPGSPPSDPVDRRKWAFDILIGLLWHPPEVIRQSELKANIRFIEFADIALTERSLILDLLQVNDVRVSISNSNYREELEKHLIDNGKCVLCVPIENGKELKATLTDLFINPIEMGWLYLYPRIKGLRKGPSEFEITLELAEAPQ